MTDHQSIYQFLIALLAVEPLVWRRIQVPKSYTFWDLHVAIQDAMGWQDYHLHEFSVVDLETKQMVRIGMPEPDGPGPDQLLPDHLTPIATYFPYLSDDPVARYVYDFGESWKHVVALEDILPVDESLDYPRCVSGRRKCPPEDSGGPWRYAEFLQALGDPHHDEHQMMTEWIGGKFDPAEFDPSEVRFDDPRERWTRSFG